MTLKSEFAECRCRGRHSAREQSRDREYRENHRQHSQRHRRDIVHPYRIAGKAAVESAPPRGEEAEENRGPRGDRGAAKVESLPAEERGGNRGKEREVAA